MVPKDWGRILLGKHGPRAGDKKGPGLRYLTCGMKQCLPAFRNDKVPLASADGGGVPALHVGEVPGPRVHTSHAGRLEPALRGRGTGHESRLGWRIRGAALSPGSSTGGCHLFVSACSSVSVAAQAPLGLPASWSLSPWLSWEVTEQDWVSVPLTSNCRWGWLFLPQGDFPAPLVASSLPAFFPSGIPFSTRRRAVFDHRRGMGLGRWGALIARVLVSRPRQVGLGQAGEWGAELRTPFRFACLPCFSLPGAFAFHKRKDFVSLCGRIPGSGSR